MGASLHPLQMVTHFGHEVVVVHRNRSQEVVDPSECWVAALVRAPLVGVGQHVRLQVLVATQSYQAEVHHANFGVAAHNYVVLGKGTLVEALVLVGDPSLM